MVGKGSHFVQASQCQLHHFGTDPSSPPRLLRAADLIGRSPLAVRSAPAVLQMHNESSPFTAHTHTHYTLWEYPIQTLQQVLSSLVFLEADNNNFVIYSWPYGCINPGDL